LTAAPARIDSGGDMNDFPARELLALLCMAFLPGCAPADEAVAGTRIPRLRSTDFPLHIECAGVECVLSQPPRRVLPANAAWVDFVSLLVGPERLAALPAEAFGFSRLTREDRAWAELEPLAVFEGERILTLAPDLVLAHAWQNLETIQTLRRAGIPVLVVPVPESWAEITATLELLGTVLGVPERARVELSALEARRVRLRERATPFARKRALSYTNLGAGGWTSGARTTGAILLELAGLGNAAAEAGLVGDVPADRERLIALAPELFLVGRPDRSESSPPSADFLLGDPALQELEAVRAKRIVALPPALFDSASPELLRGAEVLIDELERIAPAPARGSGG
jgi:iron complex transport system substrate-binding protein